MAESKLTAPDTAILGDVSAEKVCRAVTAFLNTAGGRILLGVNEDGRVVDTNHRHQPEFISENLRQLISPEPRFSLTMKKVGLKNIMLIDVPLGSDRPYVFEDTIYVWRAGAIQTASPREISEMIIRRSGEATRWEREPAVGINIEDLDPREIEKTYVAQSERSSSNQIVRASGLADFLDRIRVSENGEMLNSAVILFARRETAAPQSKIRIASFNSTDKSEFRENKLLDGNLFDLFDQATSFLDKYIEVRSDFDDFTRRDVMAIPPFVIREAIMNALVHRDYSQSNINTTIALFPDRLEIWNPGNLPDGLAAHSLALTHVSRPINPDIANVAYLRGLVEQWGSGTGRIVAECRRMGLRSPEWSLVGGGILLKVYLTLAGTDARRDLNERMKLFLLNSFPGMQISIDEYRMKWAPEVTERTARRDMDELEEAGYLVTTGSRPLVFLRTDQVGP